MKWILIAWVHYQWAGPDTMTFEEFDTQQACMKAGGDALNKTTGAGDFTLWEYAYICAPGGLGKEVPSH